MSDPAPVPAAPLDLDRWKIVLGVALPVVLIAVGTAAFFWYRRRQSRREKKTDLEDMGNMLEELRTNQAEVAAMRQSLQTGIERVKAMETELAVRETNWTQSRASFDPSKNPPRLYSLSTAPSGPRPLSGTVPQGSFPHSALGLEHHQGTLDRSTTAVSDDSGASTEYKPYKPPSTIPEESTIGQTSPFDTPGSAASVRVVVEGDGSPRNPGERAALRAQVAATVVTVQQHSNSTLLSAGGFSPLRADPSHPDLVPQPLAVIKRNSFRGSSSPTRSNLDHDIHEKSLRRWSSTSATPSTMLEREKVLVRSNIMAGVQDGTETKDAKNTGKPTELHCHEAIANAPPASQASTPAHMVSRPELTGDPFSTPRSSLDRKTPENVKFGATILRCPTSPLNGLPDPPPPACIAECHDDGNSPRKCSPRKNISFVPRPSKKPSQKTAYITPPPQRPLPMIPTSKIPVLATRQSTENAPATVPKMIAKRNSGSSVHMRPKPQSSPSSKAGSVSQENSTPQTDPQTRSTIWTPTSPLPFPVGSQGPERLPSSYASSQCLPHVATGATLFTVGNDHGQGAPSPRKHMHALQRNSTGLGQECILSSMSPTLHIVPETDKV